MRLGREVEGGVLVLRKDCEEIARRLEQTASYVRRLPGLRVVSNGTTVVTAYRSCRRKQKRLLRGAERRNLED